MILIYCFHCVTTCVRYYYYYYRHRVLLVHDDNYTQFSVSPWENYTLNYIIYSAYTYILYGYSGRISFDGVVLCDVYARRESAGRGERVGGCGNQSTVNYFLRSAELVLTNAHTRIILYARTHTDGAMGIDT